MKIKIFCRLFLIFCLCIPMAGDEKQPADPAVLFQHALDETDIWSRGPFHLQASLKIKGASKSIPGEYQLYWVDQNQWRDEIRIGGVQSVRVGVNRQIWNTPVTGPLVKVFLDVQKLIDLQEYRIPPSRYTVLKQTSARLNGSAAVCLKFSEAPGRRESTVCFDAASGLPLGGDELRYDHFASFGTKQFPRGMRYSEELDSWTIDGTIEKLETLSSPDAALFTPPPGVLSRSGCFHVLPARTLTTVAPRYPEDAKMVRATGTVWVLSRIDIDGKPQEVEVVNSPYPSLGQASLAAIKRWTFEPATCDGQPVETQMVILTHYKLGA